MRLLFIINFISPHRVSLFNHLADTADVTLRIICLAPNEGGRRWNVSHRDAHFDYQVLKNWQRYLRSKELPLSISWGLWSAMKRFQPDAICMTGYHYLASCQVLIYSRLHQIPVTLWTGSHLQSGFVKNALTEPYKKLIIPRFDSYVTYGTLAREQILHYGARPEKVVVGCNTVDVEWFMQRSASIDPRHLRELRKQYPSHNILYVGAFIPRKGVMNLIKAFASLNLEDVGLILIGGGEEKRTYERYIQENNVRNVFLHDFKHKAEIVEYYGLADVFALPSLNEVWGLVLNEAMACGLPIIASRWAGATHDLVRNGVNGYIVDPYDVNEVVDRLRQLLENNSARRSMGMHSVEMVRDKTTRNLATQIMDAVRLNTCSACGF